MKYQIINLYNHKWYALQVILKRNGTVDGSEILHQLR